MAAFMGSLPRQTGVRNGLENTEKVSGILIEHGEREENAAQGGKMGAGEERCLTYGDYLGRCP